MATHPFPFPTTGPTYAPTTIVPPLLFGCGAPAYAHCSFPPAAVYPPPLSHGGFSIPPPSPSAATISPFPFFYGVPSGYPYVAAFPTSASSSSLNWPNWPPPCPDPTASTSPATFSSFPTSTTTPNLFGAPAPTPVSFTAPGYDPSAFPPADIPCTAVQPAATQEHLRSPHSTPSDSGPTPSTAPSTYGSSSPTTPSRKHRPLQSHASSSPVSTSSTLYATERPRMSVKSRALCTGEKGAVKNGNILQPATPECQGGGLTKSNSAGGVSVADKKFVCEHSGPGIFSMPNTGLDHRLDTHQGQFQSSLESLLGELSKLSTLVSQFTVAMDRRTTEAPIIESSGCTGFLSAPSMFSAAPASVGPQVLDEMPTPQSGYENCYGYPNQSQSSCVQGGSTNLREQYLDELPHYYGFENLKRQSVFLADGTERSFYALPEEYSLKQATPPMSTSARKNVGVTSSPSVTCLVPGICSKENKTTGESLLIHVAQPPTSVQDYPCGVKEMHVSDVSDEETQNTEELLKCVVKAPETEQTIAYLNYLTDVQQQHSVEKASVHVQMLGEPQTNVNVWDPGDNTVSSSTLNRDTVIVLQTLMQTTNGIFTLPYVITVRVQFGLPASVPQQSCYGRVLYSQENYGIQFLWDPGILRWRTISAQHILESGTIFSTERMLPWNPRYAILLLHYFLWDFSMDRMLSKSAVLNRMDLKHFCTQLSLQFHSWCTILDGFLWVQYYCLPIVLDCLYPEPVQQFACYSCMFSLFSLTEAILSVLCMSSATTVRAIVVLCSGKIVQGGRDTAALYQVLQIQLPNSNTSHIWDPGIESLLFPCELIQIKGWTSMTYNGIFLSEYPYILIFLHERWELLHQQGVQKNYNAKKLLSSQNYLQICEMDIIFITFLPP